MTQEIRQNDPHRNRKPAAEFNLAVNQTHTASESIPVSQPRTNVRRTRVLVVLLVCAGGLWFLIPNSAPSPDVTILPPDYSVPAPPLPLPDRWIPMTWRWLWRLRSAVLPANPTIDIETRLVRLSNSDKPLLAEALEGRTPLTNSNGVYVWILSEQDLAVFGRRLEKRRDDRVRVLRMTTGPGVLANSSMTTMVPIDGAPVSVGDSLTQAVLKRGKSVELTGSFISWEAVTNTSNRLSWQKEMVSLRTNLTLAANLLIPPGRGVFLMDTNRANTESCGTGLLISAKLR